MRDANDSIDVFERGCQELVGQDARRVFEPKETMVRKHRAHAEKVGVQNAFLAQRRETRMGVDQLDVLPNDDRPQVRQEREVVWQGGGRGDGHERDVVYFERGEQPTDADAVWRVTVRDDDDFVAATDEVGAEHVNVVFYSTYVGVEEIRYHSA